MRIQRFASSQFRNLHHDPLDFSNGVNLLVGENGHGKTNVLEAIYFFKFGRSFRASRDNEVVRFGEDFCRAEVATQSRSGERETLSVSVEKDGTKRFQHDGKEFPRVQDLVGRYPAVLFGPHDLVLTTGFPAERRRFIDMIGSMVDRVYLEGLRSYRRVLAQRNAALKARDEASAFGVWTEELISHGCALVKRRGQVVDAVREQLQPHVEALMVPYDIGMRYESELIEETPDDVACPERFAARLAAVQGEERRRRTTLVGPHRDDVCLVTDDRDLRRFGSQGQRRLVAVLMRLAELSYLEEQLGEPCILLLDDLFSELDADISSKLKRRLDGEHQIFVTSPVTIAWEGHADSRTFRVADGRVAVDTPS